MSEFNRIENAKAEVKCTIDSDVWQNAQKKALPARQDTLSADNALLILFHCSISSFCVQPQIQPPLQPQPEPRSTSRSVCYPLS